MTDRPTAVYVGNFRHRHTTETAVAFGLEQLGWQVRRIQQHDATREAVQREADLGARLVLYTRTHDPSALGPEWTQTWRDCDQAGARTASLHLDLFRTLPRARLVERADPLFTTGTVFTPDAGDPGWWEKHGVHHVWCPPAHALIDPSTPEARESVGAVAPVVFIGTVRGYHPEHAPWRSTLLRSLARRYGRDQVGIYGNGRPVRGPELTAVLEQAEVAIGDVCGGGTIPGYWSDRVPETLARGCPLVHPAVSMLGGLHPDVIVHRPFDLDEIAATIDRARETTAGERVALRERTLEGHGWAMRLGEFVLPNLA